MKNLVREFAGFLKEYKIISLAVAFVMGAASTALVNSLVKDIFMPIISPLFPAGEGWKEAVLALGPVKLNYGSFLAEAINFLILAAIIFFVVRQLGKLEKKGE